MIVGTVETEKRDALVNVTLPPLSLNGVCFKMINDSFCKWSLVALERAL